MNVLNGIDGLSSFWPGKKETLSQGAFGLEDPVLSFVMSLLGDNVYK